MLIPIQVFHLPEKEFNVDDTDADDESALHLCARRGDSKSVELLITSGCDLARRNCNGNTPLHVVVEEFAKQPAMTEVFLQVAIYRQACLPTGQRVGIAFTQWHTNGFFASRGGGHIASINVKFSKLRKSATPCQISRLRGRSVGIQLPESSKFRILFTKLPLRGNSFAQILRNSKHLYASIGSFYRASAH